MSKFTKTEIKTILTIFCVLFVVTGFNLSISLRRGRDNIRKDDMSGIQKSLETYFEEHKEYPLSGENFLPNDPQYQKGTSYLYYSDGREYELYVALEGKDEAEYNTIIVSKNLRCGNKICNYGRTN